MAEMTPKYNAVEGEWHNFYNFLVNEGFDDSLGFTIDLENQSWKPLELWEKKRFVGYAIQPPLTNNDEAGIEIIHPSGERLSAFGYGYIAEEDDFHYIKGPDAIELERGVVKVLRTNREGKERFLTLDQWGNITF